MTAPPLRFRDGEEARAWLVERLDRLEEAVRDAADLSRTVSELTADAVAQLEGDPLAFRKTAVIHLRDLEAAVTEVAATRTQREGFHVPALERLALSSVGEDPARGRQILEGITSALRDRVEHLSIAGSDGHDEAQVQLDEGLIGLDIAMQRVVRRWESEPVGLLNRWRRRRRLARQGLEQLSGLPELSLGLAEAAREQRGTIEGAWGAAAQGAVALGIARAFTEVLDWLATTLSGLDGMARQAGEVARDARLRLAKRAGAWRQPDATDRLNLLTEELLDRILDHLGLDASGFLDRSEVRAADLGRLGRQGLEAELKRWVEGEVVRLADASLAEVFGGFAENSDTVGRLVQLMTAGQPLIRFNDDLHRLWPEGLPAQYQVICEASDGSLDAALADACIQVGLPSPQLMTLPAEDGDRTLSLRVVQLVSGLAWFSLAERLQPMTEVHEAVMAEADAQLETREGLRAALRDGVESESLPAILPDPVVDALDELQALRAAARATSRSARKAKRRRKVSTSVGEGDGEAEASEPGQVTSFE